MFTMDRRCLILGSAAVVAASALSRGYAQSPTGPFKLDPLPYPTSKNEPYIDAQTMEIHHDRHHAAYVNNLNGVMAQQPDLAKRPLLELLTDLNSVPEAVRTTVRNNGGGHANHTMFWQIMGGSGGSPKGELLEAIKRDFGGLEKLQDELNTRGAGVFGSAPEAVEECVRVTRVIEPREEWVARYAEIRPRFQAAYPALRAVREA